MRSICLLVCVVLAAACDPVPADAALGDGPDAIQRAANGKGPKAAAPTWFTVQQDYRKCAWPTCGGQWVSEIGARTTRCADGSKAEACYVVDIDWTALGYDPIDAPAIAYGTLGTATLNGWTDLSVLEADAGWRAIGQLETVEGHWSLVDQGIRCITSPCFYAEGTQIGPRHPDTVALSGLDTDAVKMTVEDQDAVWRAFGTGDLLATGHTEITQELSGPGERFVAEELYVPVQ